ncbi:MAG: hypothetical protein Q4A61_03760 [Porphyromonadaceae bacterium]|nr:hypothetical protein [Porphyromonadaceae bacterium]
MMLARPTSTGPTSVGYIELPISKSLMARRLLLLPPNELPEYLPQEYPIDILALTRALRDLYHGCSVIDVNESGTAMRFMTAYAAVCPSISTPITLLGRGRQHHRPIAPLVNTLRELGADIEYLEQEGYPPLKITPKTLAGRRIRIDASSSSQYLSALMLIAPLLEGDNYQIDTTPYPIASRPYAHMTLRCMTDWGYRWEEYHGVFTYLGGSNSTTRRLLEADWTAASYAYLCVALGDAIRIYLPNLSLPSLQGDSLFLPKIFHSLGVQTDILEDGIALHQIPRGDSKIEHNCCDCPDIVPSIVGACLGLGRSFYLTGVSHLRIKESDRLEALRQEVGKLGFILRLESDAISWSPQDITPPPNNSICLEPHGDHRIAMGLAPLFAHKLRQVCVLHPEVVSKSFPQYWQVLTSLGYQLGP